MKQNVKYENQLGLRLKAVFHLEKTGDGVTLVQNTPETGAPIGNRLVDEQEVDYRKYKIETLFENLKLKINWLRTKKILEYHD